MRLLIKYIILFYLLWFVGTCRGQSNCSSLIIDALPICTGKGTSFDINYSIMGGNSTYTITESLGGTTFNSQSAQGTLTGFTYVNQNNKVTLTITDDETGIVCIYDVLQLDCSEQTTCDCSQDNPFSISVQASGNGNGFSMVYLLVDPATGVVTQVNQTGIFGPFPANTVRDIYAINIEDGDLTSFIANVANASIIDVTSTSLAAPFNDYCYTFEMTTLTENCNCPVCEDIIVEATTTCDAGGGSYTIDITSITGGISAVGNYTVTINGTNYIFPADFPLSGQTYSGGDQSNITLTISDVDDPTCMTTFDVFELNCVDQQVCDCDVDPNSLTITAQANGEANEHSNIYVLVDATGNVMSANGSGQFMVPGNGTMYTVLAINYSDLDASILSDINTLVLSNSAATDLLNMTNEFASFCYVIETAAFGMDCACNVCEINPEAAMNILCDDNDTPGDPSDDTYTFDVVVNGNSTFPLATNTFTDDQGTTTAMAYGTTISYGPFPISGGAITVNYTDAEQSDCTAMVTAMVPATCSDATCNITPLAASNIVCNDNGTPGDPTDDTFTFDVLVNGNSTFPLATNTFTDDQGTTTAMAYGTTISYGPFPISGGAITVNYTDAEQSDCTALVTAMVPATCSDATCNITPLAASNIVCNDNGTPGNPKDDTFTFDILVNGNSTFPLATNTFTDDQGTTTAMAYGTTISYGPFPISGGAITVNYTDAEQSDCTAMVTAMVPATCSDATCNITPLAASNVVCNDNGTPGNPTDDTFTFDVLVNGSSTFPLATNTFTDDQGTTTAMAYGTTISYGPFSISGGAITVNYTDAEQSDCTAMVTAMASETCSDATCNITPLAATNIVCIDNGTPSNPTDDTYTFDVVVNGSSTFSGATNTFTDDQGTTVALAYGTTVSYGPFPISGGGITVNYTDAEQSDCTAMVTAMAPETCSDIQCLDIVVDATTVCDPEGSTYSIVINSITGGNFMSGGFIVNINGTDHNFPADFPLTGQMYSGGDQSNIVMTITDVDDPTCTTTYEVFELNCVEQQVCDCDVQPNPLTITAQASGEANGHSNVYVLIDAMGNVIASNGSGQFMVPGDGSTFTVVAINYADVDAAILNDINTLVLSQSPSTDLLGMTGVFAMYCYVTQTAPFGMDCDCGVCEILPDAPLVGVCDDNGTPADPTDDTFSFMVTVNGSNTFNAVSNTFTDDQGTTTAVAYGTMVSYGPFPISGGAITINYTDADDGMCTSMVTIEAPATCSDATCNITPLAATNIVCSDNGTPGDPTDDTYTFDVLVNGSSTFPGATNTFTDDQGTTTAVAYGTTVSYGPFPISGGAITVNYTDAEQSDCTAMVTAMAPETCSDATCNITPLAATNIVCNDNGTPSNPTDDTYTFDVVVNGSSTFPGATNTFTDDQGTTTAMAYGTTISYGPFPISGGDITINYTDAEQSDCTAMVTAMAPETCSDIQCLDIVVDATTVCDPEGGTYSIVINSITGGNFMSGGFIVNINGTDHNFPADFPLTGQMYSGGDQSNIVMTITDVDDPTCTTTYEVFELNCVEQQVCDCDVQPNPLTITAQASGEANGHSNVYVLIDAMGNVIASNSSGQFMVLGDGSTFTVVAINYVDSDAAILNDINALVLSQSPSTDLLGMTDVFAMYCYVTQTAPFGMDCDCGVCEITPDAPLVGECDDNGTPTDPSDDTFNFIVTVNGSNTSSSAANAFIDDQGNNLGQVYGTMIGYGPFSISGGPITITYTDLNNDMCTSMVTIEAPETCSDAVCEITPEAATNIICSDNGTPGDPSDDVFTFEVVVNGSSTFPLATNTFNDNQGNTGLSYGATVNYGPFTIANGTVTITFSDADNADCMSMVTVDAPETCSPAICTIDLDVSNPVVCNDNGTPGDPTDDTYSFDFTINGNSTFPNATNTFNDTQGNMCIPYGTLVSYGPFPISGGPVDINYTDADESSCTTSLTVEPPPTCSDQICEDIIVQATTICDPDSETYTIDITSITGGISGNYTVTIDNVEYIFPTDFPLTGQIYSGGDQDKIQLLIADENDTSCNTIFEVFELNCVEQEVCNCDNDPSSYNLFTQATADANGFDLVYILRDGPTIIVNQSGAFPNLIGLGVNYTVYAVHVETQDLAAILAVASVAELDDLINSAGVFENLCYDVMSEDFIGDCGCVMCNFSDLTLTPCCDASIEGFYDLEVCFEIVDEAVNDFIVNIDGQLLGPFDFNMLDANGCIVIPGSDIQMVADLETNIPVSVSQALSSFPGTSAFFISEIHYDNVGTDENEGVEITAPVGFNLTGFQLVFYNGGSGNPYNTIDLFGETISDEDCGAIFYPIPDIQNGAPDGIAFVDPNGNILQFLSYEGSFVAGSGPAAGLTSIDIGVEETNSDPANSLQFTDVGWIGPALASPGILNNNLSCLVEDPECRVSGMFDELACFDPCAFTALPLVQDVFNACSLEDLFIPIEAGSSVRPVDASNIFFSQYIEGTGANRCIEIFNGTGMAIDLTGWAIDIYVNGNGTPNTTSLPNMMIQDGDVYVVCDPDASPIALAETDLQSPSITVFTGNDDIVLVDPNGVPVDIIGTVGSAIDFGTDRTFIRACSVIEGNPDVSLTFIPSEFGWNEGAANDFSGLGDHNFCGVDDVQDICTFDIFLEDPATGAQPVLSGIVDGFEASDLGDFTESETIYVVCITDIGCVSPPVPFQISIQNLGTIACEDVIQVSLGETCETEITGDLLLSDDRNINFFDVILIAENGDILDDNVVTDFYAGQTLQYQLIDLCNQNSCWGEISVEVKFRPFLTSPCSFIPGSFGSFSGNLNNGEASNALFETIDDCQTVNIDIDPEFRYQCGTQDNLDSCEGTYTVNVKFFNIIVYTQSGLAGSSSVQLADLQVGDFVIEIIPEQENAEGTYTVEVVVSSCDPVVDCIFTCGLNDPSDTPGNGFISLSQASSILAQSCFQEVIDLRQFSEQSGDRCSGGIRNEVIYEATIINDFGEQEKIELLKQVYNEVQTPFEVIQRPLDIELPCNAPNDPESIFDLFFESNSAIADSIAISSAYPHLFLMSTDSQQIVRTAEIEVPVLVQFLENVDTIKVERFINGEFLLVDLLVKELMDSIRIETVRRSIPVLVPFTPDNPICDYGLDFEDVTIPKCGNETITLRTWTFVDWCTQNVLSLPPQRITNVDTGPVLQTTLVDQTVSIDPFSCLASFRLPDVEATDACGTPDGLSLEWSVDSGMIADGFVVDLSEDHSPVSLIASISDDCGNTVRDTLFLTIEDLIAPAAVCLDDLQVGITNGGLVFIDAITFDNGSNDSGCGDVWIKAIRDEDLRQTSNGFWNDDGPNREANYSLIPDPNFTSRFTCSNAEADDFSALFRDFNNNILGVEIGTQVFFDDQVAFCCEEIGADDLFVMVRVFDIDPGPGPVDPRRMEREPTGPIFILNRSTDTFTASTNFVDNDLFGHFTDCCVRVNLSDKIDPAITCPNIDISCIDDLAVVPSAQSIGGVCSDDQVQLLSENSLANGCGTGDILREWFIDTDNSGDFSENDPFCIQRITINEQVGRFDPFTIKWPKHMDGSSLLGKNFECDENDEVITLEAEIPLGDAVNCIPSFDLENSQAVWCDPMCVLIGYTIDVDTVQVAEACSQLIRSHTLIDWCIWDPNSSIEELDTDDQFIAVEDWAQGDCILCETGLTRIAGGEEQIYLAYESVDIDGFYNYDQILKVVDDTDPDILTQDTFIIEIIKTTGKEDEQHCSSADIIFAVAEDLCCQDVTTSTLLSWEVTVSDETGNILFEEFALTDTFSFVSPEGNDNQIFTVNWTVSDGCGNSVSTESIIIFEDLLAPTPICVEGVTTAFIREEGQVTITARDFDLGSFDACSDVRFSIVGNGSEPVRPDDPSFEDQQSIIISCDQFDQTAEFDIWVWDESANGAFCTVTITVNDTCIDEEIESNGSSLITGFIQTELGEGVDRTEVNISTDSPEYPLTSITNNNGAYSFINNPFGRDYEINAFKDGDYLNGVSTADLVLIQRHILGQGFLDSPYKVIAADVNNDGSVSSVDLIILRNVILGLTERFPNNTSWRFADADFSFTDDLNPWPYIETKFIDDFSNAMSDQNLIAVKIGDVTNNVSPNSLSKPEIRSAQSLIFTITDQLVNEAETIDIPVVINNNDGFNGFQTTIEHAGLGLVEIIDGTLQIDQENFGIHQENTTISYNQSEVFESGEVLFTMRFKATDEVVLSQSLKISSAITKTEAYQITNNEPAVIELNIENPVSRIELYQNKPNPFIESTSIGFFTSEKKQVNLSFYSVTGKLIYQLNISPSIGFNEVQIDKSIFPSQGAYFYELSTSTESHFKKLILIE